MKTKGFTLIEVLIVVVVMAVLSAIAYPNVRGSIIKAKLREICPTIEVIKGAERVYYYKHGAWYTWNNWEADYPLAETNLNIIIPKGSGAICEYRFPPATTQIEFRYADGNIVLGHYDMGTDTYTIEAGTDYEKYLKYLK